MHAMSHVVDGKRDLLSETSAKSTGPLHIAPLQGFLLVGSSCAQRLLTKHSIQSDAKVVDDEIATRIRQGLGSGRALDSLIRRQMGSLLGHDLAGVTVHDSSDAGQLSRQLNARAFTTGQDIFFGDGEYQPHSTEGRRLIAHELTHVGQQASGRVRGSGPGLTINPPDDQFEREAEAVARAAVGPIGGFSSQQPSLADEENNQAITALPQELDFEEESKES